MGEHVHSMPESLKVEKRNEKYLLAALRGWAHVTKKNCAVHRRRGIDYLATSPEGKELAVEHKADTKMHATGNVALELFSLRVNDDPQQGWMVTSEAGLLLYHGENTRLVLAFDMQGLRDWLRTVVHTQRYEIVGAQNPHHTTMSLLAPLQELLNKPFTCALDLYEINRSRTGLPATFDPRLFCPYAAAMRWVQKRPQFSAPMQPFEVRHLEALTQRVKNVRARALEKYSKPWMPPVTTYTPGADAAVLELIRATYGAREIDNLIRNAQLQGSARPANT